MKKSAVCLLTGILLLSGCGKTETASPAQSTAASQLTATPSSDMEAESEETAALRKTAAENGCAGAIIDLGYSEKENPTVLSDYSGSAAETEAYPFIQDIDEEHTVNGTMAQNNAFVIVPAKKNSHVSIYEMNLENDGTLARGSQLYEDDTGSPFILRCLAADGHADVLVNIQGENSAITDYMSYYSGMDGTLIVTDDSGSSLYDASAN